MKKKNMRLLLASATFLIFAAVNSVFAQSTVNHRYQISLSTNTSNPSVIVETSVDKELASVSIRRQNEPTHYYNSYVQIKVSTARIDRNTLFTIYHNDERIKVGQFDKKFSEVSGSVRSQKMEILAINKELKEDMQILRAIRAFDKDADVLLAELAYTIVTYDNRILNTSDSAALDKISVVEVASQALDNNKKAVADYKANKAEYAHLYKIVSVSKQTGDDLSSCVQDAYNRFNECSNDTRITDKSICYNNRSAEIQNCNSVYGGKKKPIQP